MNRLVAFRLMDTARRRQARLWAARSEVIAVQLRTLRGTYA